MLYRLVNNFWVTRLWKIPLTACIDHFFLEEGCFLILFPILYFFLISFAQTHPGTKSNKWVDLYNISQIK